MYVKNFLPTTKLAKNKLNEDFFLPNLVTLSSTGTSFIFVVFQNEIKMFASSQHEVSSSLFFQVVSCNMFIEKNGRNFCFGQLTIKGWSTVSPSRLIALYQKDKLLRKNAEEEETSMHSGLK